MFQRAATRDCSLNRQKCSEISVLMAPIKGEILAGSAGWVAVTLNVVPGLEVPGTCTSAAGRRTGSHLVPG